MSGPDMVVVLAAGVGSRLGGLTETRPKWLLDVGGGSVADRQLDALDGPFDLRTGVRVVTGHGAEHVAAHLDARGLPADAMIDNEHFATRNNWYSVLLALRACLPMSPERVFLLNSDLYAPVTVYRDFVRAARRVTEGASLAIDDVRELTDEAMKVGLEAGRIVDIGKTDVAHPAGEYIGMLCLHGPAASLLRDLLEEWADTGRDENAWYETVIRDGLLSRTVCRAVGIGGEPWVEIDDLADLRTARAVAR